MRTDFFKKYKYKIKIIDELKKILSKKTKNNKVVMCHGVFDVVHPGHIRHLAYAKSKADILIVSITADKFISKGKYRPHIPENLRALNLAAFEMVDYVMIDLRPTPLKNIKILRPDFFAKGFEYSSTGLPKATEEELITVKSYGGEMLFTPGDVVYSSSKLLENHLPNLNADKLLILMEQNSITFKSLRESLNNLSAIKVHVIGDTIIDSFTRTSIIGGQTKTPTISVLYNKKDDYIGGAGIVAKHLNAAGAKITFSTVLGNDTYMKYVIDSFKKSNISINAIVDDKRPTTNKNVIIAQGHRLLKIDKLDNTLISEKIIKKISNKIEKTVSDCIIFRDFRHGIFNNENIKRFNSNIKNGVFKVADSQVATRWGNITDFQNFDLITPNEREARFSLADQDSSIGVLSTKLQKATKYKNLILKLGKRGILAVSSNKGFGSAYNIDAFCNNLVDPVGAGDALLAYSTLIFYKTKSLLKASIIGSLAAACSCEKDGNIPIKIENIIDKINEIEKNLDY